MLAAATAVGLSVIVASAVLMASTGDGSPWPLSGRGSDTVRCAGTTATLSFDPAGKIEARVRGRLIASADTGGRRITHTCPGARDRAGYYVAALNRTLERATTITCTFPRRFWVAVTPAGASWAGDSVAGSSISLVLGRPAVAGAGGGPSIVAGATVLRRPEDSRAAFASRFCTAS
jgi:hypothetical protein